MKLTVFGATGAIGGHVVRQALDAGHPVTAVVRDPARLTIDHPELTVVTVPGLTEPEPLLPALAGNDAAISSIGPRSRKDVAVASRCTRGIVRALEQAGVRRFVAVSAAPVGPTPEGEGWFSRRVLYPVIRALFKDVYADLAEMEAEIRRGVAEWTVVRPPRLTNGPPTATYRSALDANVRNASIISRADVAHAMLAALDDPATVNHAIGVAR